MNCLLLLFFLVGSCFGPISSYIKYIVDISLDIPISARSWNNGFFFLFLFFLVANSNLLILIEFTTYIYKNFNSTKKLIILLIYWLVVYFVYDRKIPLYFLFICKPRIGFNPPKRFISNSELIKSEIFLSEASLEYQQTIPSHKFAI